MPVIHIDTMHPRSAGELYTGDWKEVTCRECLKKRPIMHWWLPLHSLGLDDIATKDFALVTCAKCIEFRHRGQYVKVNTPDEIDGGVE